MLETIVADRIGVWSLCRDMLVGIEIHAGLGKGNRKVISELRFLNSYRPSYSWSVMHVNWPSS